MLSGFGHDGAGPERTSTHITKAQVLGSRYMNMYHTYLYVYESKYSHIHINGYHAYSYNKTQESG